MGIKRGDDLTSCRSTSLISCVGPQIRNLHAYKKHGEHLARVSMNIHFTCILRNDTCFLVSQDILDVVLIFAPGC